MSEIIELAASFAKAGQLGGLRLGMSMDEVQRALGPYDDEMNGNEESSRKLYYWNDLEIAFGDGAVIWINVPTWRDELSLPVAVTGWTGPQPTRVTLPEVASAMAEAGIAWHEAPRLVLGEEAKGYKTDTHGVGFVFDLLDDEPDVHLLYSVSVSDSGWF